MREGGFLALPATMLSPAELALAMEHWIDHAAHSCGWQAFWFKRHAEEVFREIERRGTRLTNPCAIKRGC